MRGNIAILLAIVAFTAPSIAAADLPAVVDPLPKGAIASFGSTRFRYPQLPKRMLVSPDGQRLAVDGYVGIWVFHIASGEVIWREPYNGVRKGSCRAFAFSGPDAIVNCRMNIDWSSTIIRYHVPTNRIECEIHLPAFNLRAAISTDGTQYITTESKTLVVNDVKSGKVLVRIPAPDLNSGHSIHFSPNNRTVVVVNSNGLILFYDRMLGGETGRIKRSSSPKHVQFSADGSSFLMIWDSILYCYDSLTGALTRKIMLKEQCEIFAMTPNGELLTLRSDKTGIDILNVETNQYRPAIALSGIQPIHLTTTQDGKTLFLLSDRGAILAYDVATGKRLPQSASTETESSFHYPYSLSFLPHSHDRIIERTRTWAVWDVSTGRRTIIPQPPDRTKIDLSRDGTKTMEVDKDTIQIRDVASLAKIQQLPLRGLPELKHVAFSNDGTAIVGYSESAIVSINISSGKVDVKQLPKTVKFEYPTYADDGRRIAVFEYGLLDNVIKSKLTIHDLNARQSEWKIEQPSAGNTTPLAFSRNDNLLFLQSFIPNPDPAKNSVFQYTDCYDIATRKLRHRLSDVNAYAVSPDGRFVLSALPDHSLSIIEVATGKARISFPYPKFDSIRSAEFSPDSQRLATKMYSGVLYIWDVNTSDVPITEPDRDGLENAWAGLGTIDAAIGFQAIRRLSKYPAKSLPVLAGKLSPAAALNLDRTAVWLMQLDAPDYDTRRIAYRKLAAVSQRIEPQLQSIRDSTGSLELREKVQQIIDEQHLPNAENVRVVRAVEIVERIALDATAGFAIQAQAKAVLARWASGQAGAKLTDEAKFAIGRIKLID